MDKRVKSNQAQQFIHSRIGTELPEGISPYNKTLDSNVPIVKEGEMKREEDELLRVHYKLGHYLSPKSNSWLA